MTEEKCDYIKVQENHPYCIYKEHCHNEIFYGNKKYCKLEMIMEKFWRLGKENEK